jgi:hypothetical protein
MSEAAQGLPLAGILQQLAQDVVSTQSGLDKSFVSARAAQAESGAGLNPVWYCLNNVRIALELTTSVRSGETFAAAPALPELTCRLPNPVAVALYGRDAVTTTRISVEIAPIVPRFQP